GFSGGQRDFFKGVLQAGSTIIERLCTYQCPMPQNGELRGSTWVVVPPFGTASSSPALAVLSTYISTLSTV
ncbi:hypothetical protein SELMODRAFT_126483, partial [Selaginella moellendorffii]